MQIAQPWYRKNRGWYVTLHGRQIFLGKDEEQAKAEYKRDLNAPPPKQVKTELVAVLIDRFLEFVEKHRAADTYEWYRFRLNRFDKRYPDLTVQEFVPLHVTQWIDE